MTPCRSARLADRPLAQPVGPGQDAEDGPQPWAERPAGHARRQLRTGGRATSWAGQAMEPVLIHHRADRRQFGDLMPERLRVITGQGTPAPSAFGRLALDDPADLFGRDQGAGVSAMAGLPAPLLARRRCRRASLARRRIGGRAAWRSWWSSCGAAPPTQRSAARSNRPTPRRRPGPRRTV